MTYVDPIFELMGGARKIARGLGYAESTVRSWATRGSIPDPEKPNVLALAIEWGVDLGPGDFFPAQEMRTVATPVSPTVAHDVQAERGAA